jgi:hypothetical protein
VSLPGRTVSVSLTPQMAALLDELVATGLHGRTRAEAARRMLAEGLQQRALDGWVSPKSWKPTRLPRIREKGARTR